MTLAKSPLTIDPVRSWSEMAGGGLTTDASRIFLFNCSYGVDRAVEVGKVESRFRQLLQERSDPSEDFEAPSGRSIQEAYDFISRLITFPGMPMPSIVPDAEGGVQISWRQGGWSLFVNFANGHTEAWGYNRKTGYTFDPAPFQSITKTFSDALLQLVQQT